MPGFIIFRVFLPLVKLWNAVEGQLLFVLSSLEINDEEESLSQCVASRSIRRCHDMQNKTRDWLNDLSPTHKYHPAYFSSFRLLDRFNKMVMVCLPYFDNGCDELLQEGVFQQGRPVVMEEVDEQTFDMGAVLILVHKEKSYCYFLSSCESYQNCERVSVRPLTWSVMIMILP